MAKIHIDYPSAFSEFYSEQNIKDVKRIIDWLNISPSRTQSHLVKQISYSAGSLSTLINGVHPKDPQPVINVIIPIIEDEVRPTVAGEFIHTSTYRLVKMACDRAKESQKFTVVAGSPGVGKSASLLEYVKQDPNAIYICGSETTTSSVVLDELMEELNIKSRATNTKNSRLKLINKKLEGSNRLIILDEADKCAKDACDPLRTISDKTGCGVVLAGNHQLRDNIIVGNNRYDLISDRVAFWPNAINEITLEDCHNLMRPYFTNDVELGDDFNVLVKYAYEVTKGSARKLLIALIPNALKFYKSQQQSNKETVFKCALLQAIAKQQMGITNPPPLPQKRSALAIPA